MNAVMTPSHVETAQLHPDTRPAVEYTPQQEAADLARLEQLEREALDCGVDFFRSEFAGRMGMPDWNGGAT